MSDMEPDIDTAQLDRRDAPRFGSVMPLEVDGVKAQLTDLSANGVAFICSEAFEPGHRVSIGVRHLPDDFHPPSCSAEVVRVSGCDDGAFEVGARLEQPLDTGKAPDRGRDGPSL